MRVIILLSFLIFSNLSLGEEATSCPENTNPSICFNNAESLACKYECLIQKTKFCSGCISNSELLRIELSWDLDVDLDLHVWRPKYLRPKYLTRVAYDSKGNIREKRKADYKCDRQGASSKGCMKGTERINVMADAFDFTESEDRTYCAAVQRYSSSPEQVPYKLIITPQTRSVFECSGAEFDAAPTEIALKQKNIMYEKKLERCEAAFKQLKEGRLGKRPWGMMIAFEVPVIGKELTKEKFAELFTSGVSQTNCKEVLSR